MNAYGASSLDHFSNNFSGAKVRDSPDKKDTDSAMGFATGKERKAQENKE
jgi:hypothetical protein